MIHIAANTNMKQLAQINSKQDEKNMWKSLAKDLGVEQVVDISSLQDIKKHIAKTKYKDRIPSNSELLEILPIEKRKQHLQLLKIKPTRTKQ